MPRPTSLRIWVVLTILILAGLEPYAARPSLAANAGHFHLVLKRSEPGANDTLSASPTAIKLWFTESVQAGGTAIRMTGPTNKKVTLSVVTVARAPLSPAVATVRESLSPGRYSVAWLAVGTDGHPTSGTFSFTVRGP